jgi:hypothetical protein
MKIIEISRVKFKFLGKRKRKQEPKTFFINVELKMEEKLR